MLAAHRDRIEVVEAGDPDPADVGILDAGTCRDDPSALAGLGTGGARRQVVLVDDDVSPRLVRRALGLGAAGLLVTSEPADALAEHLVRAAGGAVVLSPSLEAAAAAGATR